MAVDMESSAQDKDGESQPGAAQGGEAEVAVTPAPAEKISGGRAARGARWTLFAFGAVQVIRFVSSIVLTWLVMPEAYGVIAVVMSVMMGINLFSDLGIGANIVQSASGADPRYRDTAWTIQILRGLILTLVAYAIAPVVGAYYSDYPGLSHFIQAISISSLILGLGSMSLHVLRRSISVARLSALEVFAQVMASATILIWAYYDPTPWAMVAGAIVRASTTTIASHILFGGDSFAWHRPSVHAIFSFGKWVFVSTALLFLAGQADRLIFGALIPPALLGVYGVGVLVARIVPDLIAKLVGTVAYPVYCRAVQRDESLEAVYVRCSRPLLWLGGWSSAGLCGGGAAAISLLYKPEYAEAGWILQWLAAGAWFGSVLRGSRTSALLAKGRARLVSYTSLAKLIGMVVMIPLGFELAGFKGAVVGYALSDVLPYASSMWGCRSIGLRAFSLDLRYTLWFVATSLMCFGAVYFMDGEHYAPWAQCLVVFVLDTLLWLPLLLPMRRDVQMLLMRKA